MSYIQRLKRLTKGYNQTAPKEYSQFKTLNHIKKMNKFIISLSLFILLPLSVFAQIELWTIGTGKTIPEHQLEISIFRPARFGITKSIEIAAHPIAFFALPHVQVKKNWYDKEVSLASVHALNYPTIALNMLRKRDKEGYIPIDTKVPGILAFRNEIIVSRILKERTTCSAENYLLSLKLGVQFAMKMSNNSTLSSIEKSILYPRTEIYHKRTLWYAGLDLDARFNHFINYCIDVDYLSLGGKTKDYVIEHKLLILTKLTNSVTISGGYKLVYTSFNNQDNTKLSVYPLIDLSWVYKFRKKKEMGLFDF